MPIILLQKIPFMTPHAPSGHVFDSDSHPHTIDETSEEEHKVLGTNQVSNTDINEREIFEVKKMSEK